MTITQNQIFRFGANALQFLAFNGDLFVLEVSSARCDCCERRTVRMKFMVPGWNSPAEEKEFSPCMMSLALEYDPSTFGPDEEASFYDVDVVMVAHDDGEETRTDVTYRGNTQEVDVLLKTAFRQVAGVMESAETFIDWIFDQLFEADLEPGEQNVFWLAEELKAADGVSLH